MRTTKKRIQTNCNRNDLSAAYVYLDGLSDKN